MLARSDRTHLLIVEDEADIRGGLAELFQDEGYSVAVAANGAEGLQVAASRRPDLVLLDLSMPVLDGTAFLAAFRADQALAAVPVVVVTARQNVGALDCCAVVSKPFEVDALLAVVARCVVAREAA